MDSRSEPHSGRTKSGPRLAQIGQVPHLSIALIPPSSFSSPNKKTTTPSSPSPSAQDSLPIRELLLLSPPPLRKRPKETADEPAAAAGPRRRCKSRAAQMGLLGCASPRNTRRSRRRPETEIREDKDSGFAEEETTAKPPRKIRPSKKEKLAPLPSPSSLPMVDDEDYQGSVDRIGELMTDLIMWRDVARSSLWFGLGALFFISSCFSKEINFSIFSAVSQLGLLFLGASFVSNSVSQRNHLEKRRGFMLEEDDIAGVAKKILPAVNHAISTTRTLFSGEPSMTLKVVPFFLLGAEYGHLITLWRLSMIAFFASFTIPKLYSCYSSQLNRKVDCLKWWVLEAWGACSHKKIVVASAATAFWNLSSVKTRIFTAFISLVILRYFRQHMVQMVENGVVEQEHQQAVAVEEVELEGEQERQQALVVAKEVPRNQ